MTIQIKQPHVYPYLVAVKVDGECNHFCDVVNEVVEDEEGGLHSGMYCEKCRADLTSSLYPDHGIEG